MRRAAGEKMSESQKFEFRTAPVGPRVRVIVEAGSVCLENARTGVARKRTDLAGLGGGRWSETASFKAGAASITARSLTLYRRGAAITLRQGRLSPAIDDEARAFLGAVRAVLEAAAAANPALEIDVGAAPGVRWSMSALGLAAALLGLVALIGAAASLITAEWIGAILLLAVGVSFGASGLLTLSSFNPFKPAIRLSPTALAASLAGEG